ncbi:MAG: FKBP-type peptidyl-prolyl cis-trans isomerase [Bacteroidia bacterium]|nr:FKBP-type peptidyl-prolyl cis-trans isomerase [Bacteroidia bacterium]
MFRTMRKFNRKFSDFRKGLFRGILLFAVIFVVSCKTTQTRQDKEAASESKAQQNNVTADGFILLPSGLKYKITKKASGIQPKTGDKVEVHYTGKLTNDTIFDSSYKRGQPLPFYIGKGMVIKGWEEGIALLHEGEKATFIIPPEIGYGSRQMGKIPSNAMLIFDVELMKVTPKVTPVSFDTKGKDTIKTPSGLKYIIVKEGTGRVPFAGANVTVHYTGYFQDGKMFDSSVERGQPFTFPVGKGKVIKGWDEAFTILKVGTKARLLIPWHLGYGESGAGKLIPPRTNLVFDVELLEYN